MTNSIIIRQKGIFKKPMPDSVLLGTTLRFGKITTGHLDLGKRDKRGMILYHPKHIGRGIVVGCDENTTKEVILTLPTPCTEEDIEDYFGIIDRIHRYWSCAFIAFRKERSYQDICGMRSPFKISNLKELHKVMGYILDDQSCLVLRCAMFPLFLGTAEAEILWAGTDTHVFRNWLHTKQSTQALMLVPKLKPLDSANQEETKPTTEPTPKGQQECIAEYTIVENIRFLFPMVPRISIYLMDEKTGKAPYKIQAGEVILFSMKEKKEVGKISYDDFLKRLPPEKVSQFDGSTGCCEALTEEELKQLAKAKEKEEA